MFNVKRMPNIYNRRLHISSSRAEESQLVSEREADGERIRKLEEKIKSSLHGFLTMCDLFQGV